MNVEQRRRGNQVEFSLENNQKETQEQELHAPEGVELLEQELELEEDIARLVPEGKYSHAMLVRVENGELANADILADIAPSIMKPLRRIMQDDGLESGALRVVLRRGGKSEQFSDEWHRDGGTIYLYATSKTTLILKDSEGRYAAASEVSGYLTIEPDENDIWQAPDKSLVKVAGDVVHKRCEDAQEDDGRYLLRVTIER